jgi:hypothetical protein
LAFADPDDAVGAGCGQVVGAARQCGGDPQDLVGGVSDDLDVHAVPTVLARVVGSAVADVVALGEGLVQEDEPPLGITELHSFSFGPCLSRIAASSELRPPIGLRAMVLRVKWPRPDGSGPEVATNEVGYDSSAKNVYRVLASIVAADLRRRSMGGDEDAGPDEELDKDLTKELRKLTKVLLKQGTASHSFASKHGDTIRLELSLTGPASNTTPVTEDEYDSALDYLDQVTTVAVPAVTFIAGTVFQETLQRAASDSYDGARRFFTLLRTRVRRSRAAPPEPEAELIVMRSEDGRWALHLPGNLDHEAHAALIRDFDTLVQELGDGERFTVEWRDGRWM